MKAFSLKRVECKDGFSISQCPAYEENNKEEAKIENNFTYSLNEGYNESGVPKLRRQTSSEESMYYGRTSDNGSLTGSSKQDFAIYECPAYKSNMAEDENAVDSYHYARGNSAFDLDLLNKESVECTSSGSP